MSRNYDSSSSTTNSSGAQGSLTQSSLESEATDIRNQLKELDDVELPAKKDAGKVGRKIQVNVNFFRVIVDSKVTITHFDFNIKVRDRKLRQFCTFWFSEFSTFKNNLDENCFSAVFLYSRSITQNFCKPLLG